MNKNHHREINKSPRLPHHPPAWARWLLSRMSIYETHHSVVGDFEETFQRIAARRGLARARLWYSGQALRSLPGCLRVTLSTGLGLAANYLKLALRNLRRNPLYAALNITGLAIGLAAVILIFLYVRFETSYDRYHPGADRIYRMVSDTFTGSPYIMGNRLLEQSPDVEDVVRFKEVTFWGSLVLRAGEKQVLEESLFAADPSLFRIFAYRFIHGDPDHALDGPASLVMTRSAAHCYFGPDDPLGRTVVIRESAYQVTAVIEDPPPNTHFRFNLVVSTAAVPALNSLKTDDRASYGSWNYKTYLLLRETGSPGSAVASVEKRIDDIFRAETERWKPLRLQPLRDIHLRSHLRSELEPNGDVRHLRFAAAIGLVILLVACLNFMNLASAHSLHRGREVGLRKVMGARRPQLIRQYIGEATLLAALAALLAMGLAQTLLPLFRRLTGSSLSWGGISWGLLAFFLIAAVILVGITAGAYPAFFASSFQPVKALRGVKLTASRRIPLRNLLVGIQFLVSIIFVSGTLVIWGQMHFMKNKDLGIEGDQIVIIGLPREARPRHAAMKHELLNHPGVTMAAASDFLPSSNSQNVGYSWEGQIDPDGTNMWKISVDRDFIPTFGIGVAAGEAFSDKHSVGAAYIVNQTAARLIGGGNVEAAVGMTLREGTWISEPGPIVGVVHDFNFRSLHHAIEPMVLFLDGSREIVRPRWNEISDHQPFSYLSVKAAAGSLEEAVAHIGEVCRGFIPYAPENWFFFDQEFGRLYAAERRAARFTLTLSLTAVVLAAMGLLGLSIYSVEQRRKEIGIRRVLGASTQSILLLFSRDYLRIHMAAMLIGFPLVYWAMNRWLANFAYRIGLRLELFAATALLTAALFFLAGSVNVFRSAAANPADSLRYE